MTKYVGLDPAPKGWFGVVITDDRWETDLFPSILSVWKYHSDADRILLDVPIGLPSDKRRACDVAARAKLGRRGRSVFYAPTRDAVYSRNIDEAKRINESAGYSVQNGTWSVVPRIREVDEFLDVYPSARDRFHETHPEVCFWGLNDRTALEAPDRAEEGLARRKALLAQEFGEAARIYEESIEEYTTPAYAPTVGGVDDVLDALVAAVTARRPPEEVSRLPETGVPEDERGLPMGIEFPAETTQTRLSTLSNPSDR